MARFSATFEDDLTPEQQRAAAQAFYDKIAELRGEEKSPVYLQQQKKKKKQIQKAASAVAIRLGLR